MKEDECTCVRCSECGGTGDVWYTSAGEYLGNCRSDDLDELDFGGCPECDGLGIVEQCYNCASAEYDNFTDERGRQ